MTNDTVAACRAALLKACHQIPAVGVYVGYPPKPPKEPMWVHVDDAAVCMARAIEMAAQRNGRTNQDHVRAALAAAQEGGTDET